MPVSQTALALQLGTIIEASGVEELRAATMAGLELIDIHAAFFLAPLTGDPRVGRILTNIGLPAVWERHYRKVLHLVDPLPRIALTRTGAFTWPEMLAAEPLAQREQRYLRIAGRHGLARGVGTACYGPHGRSGFLGGAWSEPETPNEMLLLHFNAIGQLSFQRYCSIFPMELEIRMLSDRELEVLRWMARGKSNAVIAEILAISASSVGVYVRRLFDKLGVSDRTSASLRGLSLGLIVSGDYEQHVRDTIDRGI